MVRKKVVKIALLSANPVISPPMLIGGGGDEANELMLVTVGFGAVG